MSVLPSGTPDTFSRGPQSLDLGAMPLGLFPVDGVEVPAVATLELIGAQSSVREGEALAAVFGGEHPTAVGFLKLAVREDQDLTLVDDATVDDALGNAELGDAAEWAVRDAVDRGLVAWIAEEQIEINGWKTSGYIVEDLTTGLGGYHVTFERRLTAQAGAITFHAPQELDVLTAPTDVIASIDVEPLQSWTLATRPMDGAASTVIATGTGPVGETTLGQFDPTLLLNGPHDLVLTATDTTGNTVSHKVTVSVEGNMKIGHFTLSFVDLAIPVSGLDIEVVRTYDSRQRLEQGDFGQGWTLDIRQGSYRNNRPPGDGWRIPDTQGPWGLPCSSVQETKSHLTTVRLSDQEVYRFRLALRNLATVVGGCYADAVFEWVDGPLPGTTLEIIGNNQVFAPNGSDRVVVPDTQEPFVPEDVKLTTRDGRIFHLDLSDGVTHVEDLNGNFLEITPEGITHSSGKRVEFERDDAGRIVRITDPMGHSNHYAYDATGDLVSFTDRVDATTRFTYSAGHYLEDIENALGVRAVRTEYDADGRMVRMIDASGKATAFDHDLENRREVITNRLGHTRVLEYDGRGNVVREVDEVGAVTVRTFDGRDNLLSETDPLGRTTTFTYSSSDDLVAIRDALGHTTQMSFHSQGMPETLTDPLGHVTTNAYTANGLLASTKDPESNITAFGYDSQGELATITDALGQTTTFEYDTVGNLVQQTDALGYSITFTYDDNGRRLTETRDRTLPDGSEEALATAYAYDAQGRVTAVTAADGSITHSSYDALGRIVRQEDALGRATTYAYDGRGQLVRTTFADGTTVGSEYDAEGRRTASIDALGRTTRYGYDPAGRPVSTTHPGVGGLAITQTYDAAGQLVASTDALGFTTTYTYDAAGRRTQVTNALGQSTSFTYDAGNHLRQVTDPEGDTMSYTPNAMGNVRFTTAPDGSVTETVYDVLGRRTATIDAEGKRIEFGYDAVGRLVAVADALGHVTSFGYDTLGHLAQQTDANGHTTRFEYDALGRETARILPDGARETFSYRADGRMERHTDFNGAVRIFTYDALGRLLERQYPDGTQHRWTYTPTGQRATATDARGGITTYTYDERDRLVSKVDPQGDRLDYAYDARGLRTGLMATVGAQSFTTAYTHDALGRVASVIDPNGDTYEYAYTPGGQLERLEYPNGVVDAWSYDARDRLVDMETRNHAGEVLQSFHYTLANTGHRLRVDESDGTVRSFEYDDGWRLMRERVTDGANALIFQDDFTYDPVGNRLSASWISADGSPQVELSTYDSRNRLVDIEGQPLTWDAGGRLLNRASPDGGPTTYRWSTDDRLLGVERSDGTRMETRYDTDGHRVESFEEVDSTPRTVDYLVDDSGGLSHVVAESENGEATTVYVRAGDQLLGLIRDGPEDRYYHLDGQGSVRTLTDATGTPTATLAYTAFGERLPDSDSSQPYGYAGEPWSIAGLAYHRARWMDPRVGRFISRDAFRGLRNQPASLHGYSYAHSDPINLVDPSGFISTGQVLAVSAAAAVITAVAAPALSNMLGYSMTTLEAVEAAGWAFLFTAVSLASPLAALGIALYGFNKALEFYFQVMLRPDFNNTQKTLAIGLLALATLGISFAGLGASASASTTRQVSGPVAAAHGKIQSSTQRVLRTGALPEGGQPIYRGIPKGHHAYDDALQGVARPGDLLGHTDAAAHNLGRTHGSRFTSWTRDRAIAERFAGPDGLILEWRTGAPPRGADWQFVLSPDKYMESELLVEGLLTGIRVTTP